MSISSDEVNFLVYRYLQESGMSHAAFTFAHESLVARSVVADSEVPPGALLSFLQKGLQYVEIETHLQEDGTERQCDEAFYLLSPHICRVRPPKQVEAREAGSSGSAGAVADFAAADMHPLLGHTSEVFTVAWCPRADLLATGGADASARVWRVSESAASGETPHTVLRHTPPPGSAADAKPRKDKSDVAVLDWHPEGTMLATGCMDGRARLWGANDGSLLQTLTAHTGQIYDIQFNPSGSYLLTGSVDKTAVVWDAATGEARQQLAFHTAPILSVDWCTDSVFATGSTDKLVQVCAVDSRSPLHTFAGHTDEVNCIQWSNAAATAGGRGVLASGSDDGTVRLWSAGSGGDGSGCIAVCSGHKKGVYAVAWAPTGEGSQNAGKQAAIASASFDGDIRVWDPSAPKQAKAVLSKHNGNVYGVAWSPDGDFLASTASDKAVHIWSARDGTLVKSFNGPAAGFEVAWSPSGRQVAACFANGAVAVLDMHM